MKKLLTTSLFTLLFGLNFIKAQQSIVIPNNDIVTGVAHVFVTGSALCDDLTLTYYLPDSLTTGYDIQLSVSVNELDNKAEFRFFTEKVETDDFTLSVSENISDYFNSVAEESSSYSWGFDCFLDLEDGNTFDLADFTAQPYAKCIEVVHDCEQIKVIEKELIMETECGSSSSSYLSYYYAGDSIVIERNSEIFITHECIPQDFHIREEVLIIDDFKALDYTIYLRTPLYLIDPIVIFNNYSWEDIITYSEDLAVDFDDDSWAEIIAYSEDLSIDLDNYILWANMFFENLEGVEDLEDIEIIDPVDPSDFELVFFNLEIANADMTNCLINSVISPEKITGHAYPNPVSGDRFFIQGFSGDVQLINQLGQETTLYGKEHYSVSGMEKGLYYLNYEKDGEIMNEKLLVE